MDGPIDPDYLQLEILNISDIIELMTAHGWDVKIESTLRGWGGKPGISVWFDKWKWHGRLMGSPVSISSSTATYDDVEIMIRETAEKAARAYTDFPNIPPRQLADGSLKEDDLEAWMKDQKRVTTLREEWTELQNQTK